MQSAPFRAIPSARPAPEFPLTIRSFLETHFRHFNAATLVDAAQAYGTHIDGGGRMLVTLAGAMSTAELGLSLATLARFLEAQPFIFAAYTEQEVGRAAAAHGR